MGIRHLAYFRIQIVLFWTKWKNEIINFYNFLECFYLGKISMEETVLKRTRSQVQMQGKYLGSGICGVQSVGPTRTVLGRSGESVVLGFLDEVTLGRDSKGIWYIQFESFRIKPIIYFWRLAGRNYHLNLSKFRNLAIIRVLNILWVFNIFWRKFNTVETFTMVATIRMMAHHPILK